MCVSWMLMCGEDRWRRKKIPGGKYRLTYVLRYRYLLTTYPSHLSPPTTAKRRQPTTDRGCRSTTTHLIPLHRLRDPPVSCKTRQQWRRLPNQLIIIIHYHHLQRRCRHHQLRRSPPSSPPNRIRATQQRGDSAYSSE